MEHWRLTVPFVARGRDGTVSVTVDTNVDPPRWGCPERARDFPVCQAAVSFDGEGYLAMLGWVQVVGEAASSDLPRRFEVDPLEVFAGIASPFAFHGVAPTLFDAPSLSDRETPLDWLAHSFLLVAPSHPMAREVSAVAGFSWGFTIDGGEVGLVAPRQLATDAWTHHLDLLSATYPDWRFLDGPVG
ncbi:MAG: hypothetical protein QNJ12_19005 [Ilumatobacter sp.]|uniref:hypothetical protein n=1 Tax=Ilumatobacter sp. TaxID=1967498 RepID=UPI00262371BC|nr:hypothetical protein [Ilumatobacter sp.]MDJ0770890.1 hypothetical protein [Ilumatobacter sp.]